MSAGTITVLDNARPASDTLPVLNLGTLDRDLATGQFVTTYTLRYTTERYGIETVIERTLPAASIERIGVVTMRCADRGVVWDIEVLDKDGIDVTADFSCFRD